MLGSAGMVARGGCFDGLSTNGWGLGLARAVGVLGSAGMVGRVGCFDRLSTNGWVWAQQERTREGGASTGSARTERRVGCRLAPWDFGSTLCDALMARITRVIRMIWSGVLHSTTPGTSQAIHTREGRYGCSIVPSSLPGWKRLRLSGKSRDGPRPRKRLWVRGIGRGFANWLSQALRACEPRSVLHELLVAWGASTGSARTVGVWAQRERLARWGQREWLGAWGASTGSARTVGCGLSTNGAGAWGALRVTSGQASMGSARAVGR